MGGVGLLFPNEVQMGVGGLLFLNDVQIDRPPKYKVTHVFIISFTLLGTSLERLSFGKMLCIEPTSINFPSILHMPNLTFISLGASKNL